MSDMTEWLKERRTIHDSATGGEWRRHECKPCADRGSEDLSIWSEDDPVAQWLDSGNPNQRADRDAIVDAHNTLPALLTAVENVLEVLDGWEPPDPCSLEGDPCLDCLMINEMRRAIEGAINE